MQTVSPVASRIIAKCGGHQAVADALKIDISRVYRFTYEPDRGGTGGLIPAKHQSVLLGKFPQLAPEDFFEARAAE
jgi:hypothetical protein